MAKTRSNKSTNEKEHEDDHKGGEKHCEDNDKLVRELYDTDFVPKSPQTIAGRTTWRTRSVDTSACPLRKGKKESGPPRQMKGRQPMKRAGRPTHSANGGFVKHSLGTRCSPPKFMEVIAALNDNQKRKVEEIGFGGLLRMRVADSFKQLGIWMLIHYNTADACFEFSNGRRIPVNPQCAKRVLGIPCEGWMVMENNAKHKCIEVVKGMYNVSSPGGVHFEHLLSVIREGEVDDRFVTSITLLALSKIIAPNTARDVSPRYFNVCLDTEHIREYNWGEYLISKLHTAADELKEKLSRNENIAWYSGSSYFLGMYYLDWIDVHGHVAPSGQPRVAFWNNEDVRIMMHADKVGGGQYATYGRCRIKSPEATCFADILTESHGTRYEPSVGTHETFVEMLDDGKFSFDEMEKIRAIAEETARAFSASDSRALDDFMETANRIRERMREENIVNTRRLIQMYSTVVNERSARLRRESTGPASGTAHRTGRTDAAPSVAEEDGVRTNMQKPTQESSKDMPEPYNIERDGDVLEAAGANEEFGAAALVPRQPISSNNLQDATLNSGRKTVRRTVRKRPASALTTRKK